MWRRRSSQIVCSKSSLFFQHALARQERDPAGRPSESEGRALSFPSRPHAKFPTAGQSRLPLSPGGQGGAW